MIPVTVNSVHGFTCVSTTVSLSMKSKLSNVLIMEVSIVQMFHFL